MNHISHLSTIAHGTAIAAGVVLCFVGPAARAVEDSAAPATGPAHLVQKYPKLSPEPFGKGVFCLRMSPSVCLRVLL